MRSTQEMVSWISEETCRLADQRISLEKRHLVDQREFRTVTRRFQTALQ